MASRSASFLFFFFFFLFYLLFFILLDFYFFFSFGVGDHHVLPLVVVLIKQVLAMMRSAGQTSYLNSWRWPLPVINPILRLRAHFSNHPRRDSMNFLALASPLEPLALPPAVLPTRTT